MLIVCFLTPFVWERIKNFTAHTKVPKVNWIIKELKTFFYLFSPFIVVRPHKMNSSSWTKKKALAIHKKASSRQSLVEEIIMDKEGERGNNLHAKLFVESFSMRKRRRGIQRVHTDFFFFLSKHFIKPSLEESFINTQS